jgi:hypothetical protein
MRNALVACDEKKGHVPAAERGEVLATLPENNNTRSQQSCSPRASPVRYARALERRAGAGDAPSATTFATPLH